MAISEDVLLRDEEETSAMNLMGLPSFLLEPKGLDGLEANHLDCSAGIDFKMFIAKDSDAVKDALDQLREVGWAKKWSSQPYVSRRMTSLRELTTLGIKNAENLAIPSVRNDAAFLFTVVGTTGFLGVLAGQLPGVTFVIFLHPCNAV
ncbi:hypothetical protein HHK36_033231 [Tetracentron sinense]|uniref:Uncharacterized protein n=1 Tax=Tetracentron sinense TaxID=13715 RepID=A0A834Y7V7_TETSI|nr:hypothetical protein HHK36_033231 [Tetracentron sinense]